MHTILIAEDNCELREALEELLKAHKYKVIATGNGSRILSLVRTKSPDLLLLDVVLPDTTAFEICNSLRHGGANIPVILMSCKMKASKDVVRGLDGGADDYLLKPFASEVLLARIRARLRTSVIPSVQFDDVKVDLCARRVWRADREVILTSREFELLTYLIGKSPRVITRDELLREIFSYNEGAETRTVDTHIYYLRRKLERDPARPRHLLADRGAGYRFV